MELLTLDLPWPPSVNHYWGQRGNRKFLTPAANAFRWEVLAAFNKAGRESFPPTAKLSLVVHLYPPDKRKRDIDNVLKPLLDALQHAGVYEDDYQITNLNIVRSDKILNRTAVQIQCL